MMDHQSTQSNREGLQGLPDSYTPPHSRTAQKRTAEPGIAFALPVVVSEWQKNNRDTIRLSLAKYQGRLTFDARIWYDAGSGELRPSPKGLTVELKHLPALAAGVAAALQIAIEQGLLEADGP